MDEVLIEDMTGGDQRILDFLTSCPAGNAIVRIISKVVRHWI